MSAARHGLLLVLVLAFAVRLPALLFERKFSHDSIEYENIADNLAARRGFVLDIKAYWAIPTPVTHYAFYERPILLPSLLALLRLAMPAEPAARLIGPLLFLLALALIHRTIAREAGPETALSAGVLLAVNPMLHEISLFPLSETTTILAIALILWSHFRMHSPILAGIACSLAFLARPSMGAITALIGLAILVEAIRIRQIWRVFVFAALALVGPACTAIQNRAYGAPLTLLPQSFLFKEMNFANFVHYFHQGRVYPSGAELLREHGPEVARLVAKNALNYFKALIELDALGPLIALMPIAMIGLIQGRPMRRWLLLGAIAAADLGLYVISWATFDSLRFTCIFMVMAILMIVLGTHEVLDREPLLKRSGAWLSGASFAVLAVASIWFVIVAGRGYVSFREWQLGRPLDNYLEPAWLAKGVGSMARQLNQARAGLGPEDKPPIVASNEPWLVYDKTHLPAGVIPYDMQGKEWLDLIGDMGASIVVIHRGDWPATYKSNMDDLAAQLKIAGWEIWLDEGMIQAWSRPLKQAT